MAKVGEKMQWAVELVKRNPGCTKLLVAEMVGPHGSRQYGYRTVDRAIRAGLIRAEYSGNRYHLFIAN